MKSHATRYFSPEGGRAIRSRVAARAVLLATLALLAANPPRLPGQDRMSIDPEGNVTISGDVRAKSLFLPIIERVWLKHQVSPRVIAALLVGFGGVVCVLRPGAGMFTPIAFIGAASAVFAAVAQVGIRQLTATEPVPRIVFYFGAIASAISAVPLLWTWVEPSPVTWMALAGTGVAATAGQLLLTRGYSHAPAASVGPFIYVGVLCSAAIDWLFWDTPPDVWFAAGALLIISAGMALLRTHDAIDA